MYEDIFTKYGVPREIFIDQGPLFTSKLISKLVKEYEIRHRKLTPSHPQANRKVEVTNRDIDNILTKIVQIHRKDWTTRLLKVVWAYRTTWKIRSFTPYELVYGKTTILLIEFEYKTLRTIVELDMDLTVAQKERLHNLNGLDEIRMEAMNHIETIQKQRTKWHDQFIKTKAFNVGDWALLYDSRINIIRGSYNPNGWDPMKYNRYSPMEQSNYNPQMQLYFHYWLTNTN